MCAIAGVLGLDVSDDLIDSMLSTMLRRGPDGTGIYREGECCLLHARLAIVDPETGAQPMKLTWAGKNYCLVYNGELYNTEEIRCELLSQGHSFRGHSDTEVVLHAYAEWKDACLQKFNGIFAFAVWEADSRRLFLARDRIGVKPLFYMLHAGGLLFASEVKTILRYPTVDAVLDGEGAAQLLMLGPGRMPGSGVFRGIQELKPGWCAVLEDGKLTQNRYWRLTDREHRESFTETAAYVRFLVTDAIRRQMVSDMPLGTFLSGGLDSSIITAVCAKEFSTRGMRLPTFSVDYSGNELYFVANKFQPDSDGAYIRRMQRETDSIHSYTVLTPEALYEALREATAARDLPGMADVDSSLLLFCQDIRSRVKVALSGECADEIFGGYPWYRDPEVTVEAGFPWAQNTAQRARLMCPLLRNNLNPYDYVMDACMDTCRDSDILPGNSPRDIQIKQMVNLNFQWFMQTLLDRKDRMSMYCSLEVRVPFCDYRIAEYLYGVPWAFKDSQGREKGLLREAVRGLLPDEVLLRKKSPYPKTFHPEYTTLVGTELARILDNPAAPLHGLIDKMAVREMLEGESPWPWYGQLMRRPQTMAYLLQVNHWLEHYKVNICL